MGIIIRNVRDIDSADREALEHVVGSALHEGQQIIIQLVSIQKSTPSSPGPASEMSQRPRDEWERCLLGAATDCGVALSNEAVSSEGLYE